MNFTTLDIIAVNCLLLIFPLLIIDCFILPDNHIIIWLARICGIIGIIILLVNMIVNLNKLEKGDV